MQAVLAEPQEGIQLLLLIILEKEEGRGGGGVVNILTLSSSASLHDYNSSTQLTLTNGISFAHRTRNHLGRDD